MFPFRYRIGVLVWVWTLSGSNDYVWVVCNFGFKLNFPISAGPLHSAVLDKCLNTYFLNYRVHIRTFTIDYYDEDNKNAGFFKREHIQQDIVNINCPGNLRQKPSCQQFREDAF